MKAFFLKSGKSPGRRRRGRRRGHAIWSVLKRIFSIKQVRIGTLALGGIIFAAGLSYGVYFAFTDEYFDLEHIEIISNSDFSASAILDYTNSLKGENIFSLRPSVIQDELMGQSVYMKELVVEKQLPDTLVFRVTERIPEFVVVNLNGSYLIDNEGTIIAVHQEFSDHGLSESDIDTLRGYETIEETTSSSLSSDNTSSSESAETDNEIEVVELTQEEERALEVASLEEKKKLRTQLEADQQLVISKVRSFWNDMIDENDSFYYDYTQVYSFQEERYQLGVHINYTVHTTTREVISADWDYLHPVLYTWESNVKMSVLTAEGTKVFFSMNQENPRDVSLQLEDLKVVLAEGRFHSREYIIIDLGNDKILYTQK